MTGENAPPLDGWQVTRHACPFDPCFVCDPHEGGGTYPLPESIQLGEN